MKKLEIQDILYGIAVGDALGVPVEFKSRQYLKENPVTEMIGWGTHYQPIGTWSDDTSLSLCLTESLCKDKFDISDLGNRFINWRDNGYWGANDTMRDIGNTTLDSILRLKAGVPQIISGGFERTDNGNGSLMRILPLLYFIKDKNIMVQWSNVKEVSQITHGHIQSKLACMFLIQFAEYILKIKQEGIVPINQIVSCALSDIQNRFNSFIKEAIFYGDIIPEEDIFVFNRLINLHPFDWVRLKESEIKSSGYVIDTLEASIYCLLNSNSYKDAVLKAVNLGEDTDTTGAVTGGLAGILYGYENIPAYWIESITNQTGIENLAKYANTFIL
jgi:ADP-ribosylglycohydrolase